MIWFLGGYIWMYVHRPFEVWPALGDLQIERLYMVMLMLCWAVTPGKAWTENRIHLGVLGYCLAIFISWVVSPYRDTTSEVVENTAKVSIFYLMVVTVVRDEKTLKKLLLFFVASLTLYLAHSFLEFSRGRYTFRMGIPRMGGVDVTYSDPNAFAATLIFSMPLTLPLWYDRPGTWMKVWLGGFTVAAVMAVMLTGSRSGFIGMCFCGLLFIMISKYRKQLLLLAVAAAVVTFVGLPERLQNRFLTIVDPSYGPSNARASAESRWILLARCVEVWEASPLVGWGPSSFFFVGKMKLHAHNSYGQVLAELGLMGALAWAILLAMFAWNMLEVWRLQAPGQQRTFPYHVCRAVCCSVLLLLLMGMSGHNLYRYSWLWLAAFQVVAVHCARVRAVAVAAAYRPLPVPRFTRRRLAPERPDGAEIRSVGQAARLSGQASRLSYGRNGLAGVISATVARTTALASSR